MTLGPAGRPGLIRPGTARSWCSDREHDEQSGVMAGGVPTVEAPGESGDETCGGPDYEAWGVDSDRVSMCHKRRGLVLRVDGRGRSSVSGDRRDRRVGTAVPCGWSDLRREGSEALS